MTEKQKQESALKAAAREYVEKQLAIMKEHGSAPRLSRDAYNAIVEEVVEATSR